MTNATAHTPGRQRSDSVHALIEAEFEAKAPRYEAHRLSGWYRSQGLAILDALVAAPVRGTVVDIGCGTGWLLRELARREPHVRGIGIDLSSRMVAEASRRAAGQDFARLRFIRANWETDSASRALAAVAGGPVELITCVSTFHYFQDPLRALQRMAHHLAPAGVLLLLERRRNGSVYTAAWDLLHRAVIRDGTRFYTEPELIEKVRTAGFGEVRVLRRIRRMIWQGKIFTSLVLVEGKKLGARADCRSASDRSEPPPDGPRSRGPDV